MKKLSLIIAAVFVFGVVNLVKAQDQSADNHNVTVDVPSFAILDIESSNGSSNITLEPTVNGLEAGDEVSFTSVVNNNLWLNYTAIADNQGNGNSPVLKTRKISVQMDKVISGLNINLKVKADAGNGEGTVGNSSYVNNDLTLSTGSQEIIGGIGTCYTGDGANNGHQLIYSLDADDYSSLLAGSEEITVTYTITDENGGGSN
jgi:uncharacterized protein YdgA (DUF945 family)